MAVSESDVRVAINAGLAAGDVKEADDLKYIVIPEGATLRELPDMRVNPLRKTGIVKTRSVRDFIALVNREKGINSIVLCDFTKTESATCRAVIDFHGAGHGGYPQWCEYDIALNLTVPPEFQSWQGIFGRYVKQVEFAEFIEEHSYDVSKPDGAQIMEVALTLQEVKKVDFMSGTRLQNGDVNLTWNEQSTTTAGKKGDVEVPSEITLCMPMYEGFTSQLVKCVLRYKIEGGQLFFMVKPMNLADVIRKTREQVVEEIRGATGLLVADGSFAPIARKV